MAAFLDLMGFARGAEFANQQNQNDVTFDTNARAAEENLRQSQQRFDIGLPVAQANAENMFTDNMGARRAFDIQTSLMSELASVPREQQAQFIADNLSRRIANLGTAAGGGAELNALRDFATMQAQQLAQAGDTAGAQAIMGAIPGDGQAIGDQLGEVDKWSNPQSAFEPMNLATGAVQYGGRYNPATQTIEFQDGRAPMSTTDFVAEMRSMALNRTADRTPGMQARQQAQQRDAQNQQLIELFKQYGIVAAVEPNSNTVQQLFRDPNFGQTQPQTGGNMSVIPGMQAPGAQIPEWLQSNLTAGGQTFNTTPAVNAMPAQVSGALPNPFAQQPGMQDPYSNLMQPAFNAQPQPQQPGLSWTRDAQGQLQLLQPARNIGGLVQHQQQRQLQLLQPAVNALRNLPAPDVPNFANWLTQQRPQ